MRVDIKTEQPPWPFTCYAHQRGEANDVSGDFSYEEVSHPFEPSYSLRGLICNQHAPALHICGGPWLAGTIQEFSIKLQRLHRYGGSN